MLSIISAICFIGVILALAASVVSLLVAYRKRAWWMSSREKGQAQRGIAVWCFVVCALLLVIGFWIKLGVLPDDIIYPQPLEAGVEIPLPPAGSTDIHVIHSSQIQ